jgi:hypothetical protein
LIDQHQAAHLPPARDISEKPPALDAPSHRADMIRTAIGFSYTTGRCMRHHWRRFSYATNLAPHRQLHLVSMIAGWTNAK